MAIQQKNKSALTNGTFNVTAPLARTGFGGGPLTPSPSRSFWESVGHRLANLVRLDTLAGQFLALALAEVALALIGMLVVGAVLNTYNRNFKDVVSNSTPGVVAAQELGQALSSLDTAAASVQVASRVDISSPDFYKDVYGENGLGNKLNQTYQKSILDFNNALFRARASIAYPGAADAIQAIAVRFGDYVSRLELMRYELRQGHRENALVQYKAASDIRLGRLGNVPLQNNRSPEEILSNDNWSKLNTLNAYVGIDANIAKLARINSLELQKTTAKARSEDSLAYVLMLIAIVASLALVGFLSVRYALITHRVLNLGFTLAFVMAIVMLVVLFIKLGDARKEFSTIAEDSFRTIDATSQAEQALLTFSSDESHLLLSPSGSSLDSSNPILTSDVRQAFDVKGMTETFSASQKRFRENLDIAWSSISFPGERQALCSIQDNPTTIGAKCADTEKPKDKEGKIIPFAWVNYLDQHKAIISNFDKGLLAEAIKINYAGSNESVSRTLVGLEQLSQINKQAFDKAACDSIGVSQFGATCSGTGYLNFLQFATSIIFPLIALAALAGAISARRMF